MATASTVVTRPRATTPAPTKTSRRPRARRTRWGLTLVGVGIAGLILLPYLIMLVGALKPRAEILAIPPAYLPQHWTPENFATMWNTPETPLPQNLVSTLVMSLGGTLLAMVVAIPAAYYTSRMRFRLRGAFLLLVLVTQMLQPTVLVAGLFQEFIALGLVDTWLALILINAAFNLSFAIWILHSFFSAVPAEIEEAAWLDGCDRLASLRRVMLPLVWPGLVTAIVFTFIACWNEFAASLVLLSTDANQPLTVALTKFVGQYDVSWQYVFGVSIVGIVPVVVLFGLIERHLVAGLTAGGVK